MQQPIKKLVIAPEVAAVLRNSDIDDDTDTASHLLRLPNQLDRPLYEAVNKILEAFGGKWNRQRRAHVFAHEVFAELVAAVDKGELIVTKEGWFPTPPELVTDMLNMGQQWQGGDILEPSAGEGAIVEGIIKRWPEAELSICCIEQNPQRAAVLEKKGHLVQCADFLTVEMPGVFQRCYLNPPFERQQDILHVRHAYDCLAPGGELVAIMSGGTFTNEGMRICRDFRKWLEGIEAWDRETLDRGAFKASGTMVSAEMVYIQKGREA